MARMNTDELRKVIDQEVTASTSWENSEIAADRERNMRYYHGQPMGNEVPGRSQVVSWDVFEVIESALPSMLEPFFAGDDIGEFEPAEQGDEAAAEQATDYINYLVKKKNDGFITFNTWIKDGLLSKVGIVRAWWDATPVTKKGTYRGLTAQQLTRFVDDPRVTITAQTATPDPDDEQMRLQAFKELPDMPPEQAAQVQQQLLAEPEMLYEIDTVTDSGPRGVRIDNVPPESFIIGRGKKLADVPIIGEHREYTRSELVAMGYDKAKVADLSDYDVDGSALMNERNENTMRGIEDSDDPAMQRVALFFGFVRVDFDGDGIAEWRRVLMGGNDFLENEEVDGQEYCLWSPIMLPHKVIGMALADPIIAVQDSKTALTRQYLDSLYIANNPTTYALKGANIEDLLSNRIGRVVRMSAVGDAGPMQTTLVANESLQGIELMNTIREERSGVSRHNQGLDADSLNKTATGARIAQNRDQKREMMVLRIFAETGCKDLFKRVLALTCMYQDKPATIRLRNTWVDYDPRTWSAEMDVNINVGLGTGDKTETIGFLSMMAGYFQQAGAMGIVRPENVYNLGKMLLKAGKIQGGEAKLLTDPNDPSKPMPPPSPTPEQTIAEAEIKLETMRQEGKARDAEYKREADAATLAANKELKTIELQLKEKEVRIKEIELGLKDIELRAKLAESGNKDVDDSAPNALLMIADLNAKIERLASAETHIVRDPETGKALHSVKLFPPKG